MEVYSLPCLKKKKNMLKTIGILWIIVRNIKFYYYINLRSNAIYLIYQRKICDQ